MTNPAVNSINKTDNIDKITIRQQKIAKDYTAIKFKVLLFLTGLLLLIAAFAPYIVPFDPYAQNLNIALQPPNATHLLGTDRYGRDLLSRVIMGAQTSIYSALLLVFIIVVIGTCVGIICAHKSGKIDTLLMRISDTFLAFPGLVFALAVAGVLGGGVLNAVIALACITWPKYARLARSQYLTIKYTPFIAAAKMGGCNSFKIIYKHVLPNIIAPILITATLDIGTMMMEIAGLSFLGLGAMPPTAEWGSMMSNGRSMLQTAPWVILAPGCAIFISVVLFNLLGDTVRDILDPRQKSNHL